MHNGMMSTKHSVHTVLSYPDWVFRLFQAHRALTHVFGADFQAQKESCESRQEQILRGTATGKDF